MPASRPADRKSTRLNSSHTEIYTLSLHDALPISNWNKQEAAQILGLYRPTLYSKMKKHDIRDAGKSARRSEEHTSELQSHRDLHSFPTRRSSDLQLEQAGSGADPGPLPPHALQQDEEARHPRCRQVGP